MDLIEKDARRRAKNFFNSNPQISNVKLISRLTDDVISCECGKTSFKLYKKLGGIVLGKYNKVIANNPIVYNYICKCGYRLIIKEDNFKFGKIKYGCSAGKCPFGKNKMDKDCLSCKYIYEK